jgi:hypothetical protein
MVRLSFVAAVGILSLGSCQINAADDGPQMASKIRVNGQADQGFVSFEFDGNEVMRYEFSEQWALPHVWPLRSPSGKNLLVQKTEPFPHHRSLWIADKLQLEGGKVVDYYHEWKNLVDKDDPTKGHHSFIRNDSLEIVGTRSENWRSEAFAIAHLTWIGHGEKVMAQTTEYVVVDHGDGQYALHMNWEFTAKYGDVHFKSDWVHYGWPFVRMSEAFKGDSGGVMTVDDGRVGQEATNQKYARWLDYSNTVDGVTEGLAVFTPDDGLQRKWLTRAYGTFGPRRVDERSGKPFTLKNGESLSGSTIIFVHNGGVEAARAFAADLYGDSE